MNYVLPGDVLDMQLEGNAKLGPGLLETGNGITAIKAGILINQKPNKFWIENKQKRYIPAISESVVGVIVARHAEFYKVDIGANQQATLSVLAFEGATKRNRPNLQIGDLVYCKVVVASKDMEPEVSCIHDNLKSEGLGELKGGFVFNTFCNLSRKLSQLNDVVLDTFGKTVPFEIVTGMNGKIWIKSSSPKNTIILYNLIKQKE